MDTAINKAGSWSTKYQLPLYFLLTYLLSWWAAPFIGGQIIPYGPAIAALLVLALTAGRPGLARFWRGVTRWRVSWYWYLLGPALIAGYQGLAFAIYLLAGASLTTPPALPSPGTILELLLIGGVWEEPGWSGYALPELQKRFAARPNGRLLAALTLGVFRAIWHLPLYLNGAIYWFDILIFAMAFQLIVAWLYNRSGGSVPVVMVFHLASNVIGAVMSPVFSGSARTGYYALFMGLAVLSAITLAVWEVKKKSIPAEQGSGEAAG